MFGLFKKKEVQSLEINEAYHRYEKNPQKIVIICLDELKDYDQRHIASAECFPFRLLKDFGEYYPEKDLTYYMYAINKVYSYKATLALSKQGYDVYDIGSFLDYRGVEEGNSVRKKYRRRKK